jgi:exopolysaccharide biosynthesis polyprenyl glycosylphosphotransferase
VTPPSAPSVETVRSDPSWHAVSAPGDAGPSRHGIPLRALLITADLVGLTVAFVVSGWIYRNGASDRLALRAETLTFAASLPVWALVAHAHGLYDNAHDRTGHGTVDDISGVFHLIAVGGWLLFFAVYASGLARPDPAKLMTFLFLAVGMVTLFRWVARAISRRQTARIQNVVIVGAGRVGQLVAKKLRGHPEYGMHVVGFVDDDPMPLRKELGDLTFLGSLPDLPMIARERHIDRVVITFCKNRPEQLALIVGRLQTWRVVVDIVPQCFDSIGPSAFVDQVEGLPLVGVPPLRLRSGTQAFKRAVDLVGATVALVLLAPVLAAIAIRIRLDSPGPVFYRHERIGRRGAPFELFKFRTMYVEDCRGPQYGGARAEETFTQLMVDPARRAEFETTFKLQDDPRVTPLGRRLRRMSVDELPQLLNVVRGDLSLVGPRPVTQEELRRYGADAEELLTVRPGVTGYWQINGRSEIDYEERVRLDKAYLRSRSLTLDCVILAKTVRVMLSRSGAF